VDNNEEDKPKKAANQSDRLLAANKMTIRFARWGSFSHGTER
jgi:hypothetical protein